MSQTGRPPHLHPLSSASSTPCQRCRSNCQAAPSRCVSRPAIRREAGDGRRPRSTEPAGSDPLGITWRPRAAGRSEPERLSVHGSEWHREPLGDAQIGADDSDGRGDGRAKATPGWSTTGAGARSGEWDGVGQASWGARDGTAGGASSVLGTPRASTCASSVAGCRWRHVQAPAAAESRVCSCSSAPSFGRFSD